MARFGCLLPCGVILLLALLASAKEDSEPEIKFPTTLPDAQQLHMRDSGNLARNLNRHMTASENEIDELSDTADLDDNEEEDEEEGGDREGNREMQELDEIYDEFVNANEEVNVAHKDADDDAFMEAFADDFASDPDGSDADNEELGKLEDDQDDEQAEEEQESIMDEYAAQNEDEMDFMSNADEEVADEQEPIVAEEQTRNEMFMHNYSPKVEKK